ncbi:unnamed protein product, partial [Allacma fusca]
DIYHRFNHGGGPVWGENGSLSIDEVTQNVLRYLYAHNTTGHSNQGYMNAQTMITLVNTGDHNNLRLNQPSTSNSIRPKKIEFNIQECVATFTGREDVLEELHKNIVHNRSNNISSVLSQAVVICGMPGVGKTETVRRYIQLHRDCFDHVLWINAESYPNAKNCFLRLATIIPIDVNYNGKQKADEDILDAIYDHVCQKFTLIAYDNLESIESLHQLTPRAMKTGWRVPAIIITTRHRNWKTISVRKLEGLTPSESLSLLSLLEFEENEDNRQCARCITDLCQGMPIVLQRVIALVRHNRDAYAALNKEPAEAASQDVYTIFAMTFQQLATKTHGDLALQCLDVMALLNPDNIPTVLLQHFLKKESKLADALILLHDYNLVTRAEGFYQIHRMIQAVKLEYNTRQEPENKQQIIIRIMNSFTEFLTDLPINTIQIHEILDNAIRLNEQAASEYESELCITFQITLVSKLMEVGKHVIAVKISEEAYKSSGKIWGDGDPRTLKAKYSLANALKDQGENAEAEKLYQDILEAQAKIESVSELDTLTTKKNLAAVWKNQAAEDLYQEFLATKMKTLGPNNPDTLKTIHNLGLVWINLRKYQEAKELYVDLVETEMRIFGPDHPDTLRTKHNLGMVWINLGKFEDAHNLCQDVQERRMKLLGPNHPDTLMTKQNIVTILIGQGKYTEALKLCEDIFDVRLKTLGPDHPHTRMLWHLWGKIITLSWWQKLTAMF